MHFPPRLIIGLIVLGSACAVLAALAPAGFWARLASYKRPVSLPSSDPLVVAPDRVNRPLKAPPIVLDAADWPGWRGPAGNNHASGVTPPLSWSEEEHILWKSPLPGRGHSSPAVVGERVFLTTADEAAETQSALAVASDSGEVLWRTPLHQGGFIHSNPKSSHASSTPVSDGRRVFTLFARHDAIWLSALTLEGEVLWQKEVGPYVSKEGFGASPLIVDSLVIVAADNLGRSWLAAVHRITGEIVWRVSRGPGTSYASPVIVELAGKKQIVMAGLGRVEAYDPESGETLWSCPGPTYSASTPAVGDGLLVVTSSLQDTGVFGVDLRRDPPEPTWRHPIKAEVPSPLHHDGLVYVVQDIGVMACIDAESGELLWRKRLGGNATSSPVLVNDHVLVSLEDGRTAVLRHGPEFEQLHENALAGGIFATPAISNGRIFLRTTEALYCIGDSAAAKVADR
jgi:outer membrane protein assembly factor BamB